MTRQFVGFFFVYYTSSWFSVLGSRAIPCMFIWVVICFSEESSQLTSPLAKVRLPLGLIVCLDYGLFRRRWRQRSWGKRTHNHLLGGSSASLQILHFAAAGMTAGVHSSQRKTFQTNQAEFLSLQTAQQSVRLKHVSINTSDCDPTPKNVGSFSQILLKFLKQKSLFAMQGLLDQTVKLLIDI